MNNLIKQFYENNSPAKSVRLSQTNKENIKNKIMSKLNSEVDTTIPASNWQRIASVIPRSYVLLPLLIILFVGGTTYVSASALPGDVLYPLKRKVEEVQLFIEPTIQGKTELKVNFAKRRLEELEELKHRSSDQQKKALEAKEDEYNQLDDKSGDSSDKDDNDDSDDRNNATVFGANPLEQKAKQEAKDASEFLKETQEDLKNVTDDKESKEIEDQIKNFDDDDDDKFKVEDEREYEVESEDEDNIKTELKIRTENHEEDED